MPRTPSPGRSKSPTAAAFSLDELRYEYPEELCPPGVTPTSIWPADLGRRGGTLSRGHAGQGPRADRARADADRGSCSTKPTSSPSGTSSGSPARGHSLPGPRLGRELGRLLLPGRHVRRSRADRRALRAVRQQRAERSPRHRRRLRARAPRGSAAVRLRQVRPRPGRHDGRGHHLPPALGRPRRRQGAGPVARPRRSPGRSASNTTAADESTLAEPAAAKSGIDPRVTRRTAARAAGQGDCSAFRGISRSTSAAW